MINSNKELFEQMSVDKQFRIYNDNQSVVITNGQLYQGEFTLKESICSETSIKIGSCEASQISFTAANTFSSLKGQWLNVDIYLDHSTTPWRLGRYKVESDKPAAHRMQRQVVAYDALYDVINGDYTAWYLSLWSNVQTSMTVKQFRDLFFTHVGITQETTTLINDSFTIYQAFEDDNEVLTGKEILDSICEFNGVFGHIGRDNVFHYINVLSGSATLIDNSQVVSVDYEEFSTGQIDAIVVYRSDGTVLTRVGSSNPHDAYSLSGIFITSTMSATDVQSAATTLLNRISGISYIPFSGEFNGNPCYEVGDKISFKDRTNTITTILLEREMRGIQSLRDNLEASGTEHLEQNYNSNAYRQNSIEKQIETIRNNLNNDTVKVYILKNFSNVVVEDGAQDDTLLMHIDFTTVGEDALVFDIQIRMVIETTVTEDTDYDTYNDVIGVVRYELDSVDAGVSPTQTWDDSLEVFTLHFAIPVLTRQQHTFDIYMSCEGGTITIPALNMMVIMTGNGLVGDGQWNGIIEAEDTVDIIEPFSDVFVEIDEDVDASIHTPVGKTTSDSIGTITFRSMFNTFTDSFAKETPIMEFTTTLNTSLLTYTATISSGKFVNGDVILPALKNIGEISVISENTLYVASFDGGETWLAYSSEDGWVENLQMTEEQLMDVPTSEWDDGAIIKAIIADNANLTEIKVKGASLDD